ncbi:MAG: thymidylate synthase (FAD) [Lentimonas sp.]|jgi:thymidylate synthase (FAD)
MKILDKGFVKLVDHMGGDDATVQSARVSYGAGTKTLREDDRLIKYLIDNEHLTPLEMTVFKFHVKAPIFIARQWFRHRASTFNEISARYSVMKDDFYIPKSERIQEQSAKNKQCSGEELGFEIQEEAVEGIRIACDKAFETYKHLLDIGVARETARMVLPVNLYTEFYWKVDLRNLLHFVALRSDSHAQWEIREYSDALLEIIKEICPSAVEHFLNKNKD